MEEVPSLTKSPKKEEKKGPYYDLKIEVAEELGLLDKAESEGWGALSSAESGRIGGHMTRKLKERGEIPPN